jgi:hypothetical protein
MGAQTGAGIEGQPASAPRNAHTTQPSVGDTKIPSGHDGHGMWAFLRRQPIRMVQGGPEGGYTDLYEVICPDCGDHPRVAHRRLAAAADSSVTLRRRGGRPGAGHVPRPWSG